VNSVHPFPNTRCSILEQLNSADDQVRGRAYESLVRGYWQPIYAYLRLRWRLDPADAQDATQSFLAAAWSKGYLEKFDADKARFRTFLRVCLDRFLLNQRKSETAAKRGGSTAQVPVDLPEIEAELAVQNGGPADENDLLRREYIRALFARAVARLQAELAARGRLIVYQVFDRYDLSGAEPSYAEVAAELNLPVTQVTNHLHAARRRFRELVLDEIRVMSGTDEEYREEVRDILGIAVP